MNWNCTTVIFDLDGTLIDSAASIATSLRYAFEKVGVQPVRTIDRELIGPPLKETILALVPLAEINLVDEIAGQFKANYDGDGCLRASPYEQIPWMIAQLRARGLRTFVATNKRSVPTRKIIEHLQWTELFEGAYTLDCFNPALESKAQLLELMLESAQLTKESCVYVGDRHEDFMAAKANQLPFIFVSWGYGRSDSNTFGYREASSPRALIDAITDL